MKYRICLPWNGFFATCVYLWGNLRVRLATQHKSLHKLNLRPLATTCRSVWPGVNTGSAMAREIFAAGDRVRVHCACSCVWPRLTTRTPFEILELNHWRAVCAAGPKTKRHHSDPRQPGDNSKKYIQINQIKNDAATKYKGFCARLRPRGKVDLGKEKSG